MSGGGGSNRIEDTAAQKKLASIAAQRFNLYQKYYVPLENQFIGEVKAMSGEGAYKDVEGVVSSALNPRFQNARNVVNQRLFAQNVDPSSGRFSAAAVDLTNEQGRGMGLGTAAGLSGQTDRYYQGLSNIVAMGQGQAGTAISGLGDIAGFAGDVARAQSRGKLDKYVAGQEMAGTAVGTGLGIYGAFG